MATAQVWTLIGLLATALFALLAQMRSLERRVADLALDVRGSIEALAAEVHRGFGELRGDIAVIKAQISRGD
jgi:hypothetical protein